MADSPFWFSFHPQFPVVFLSMKGIVFDIRRYAVHDGPGIRTTVFLKGCPLRCFWCHNPESWLPTISTIRKRRPLDGDDQWIVENVGREMTCSEVMESVTRDRLYYEESGGGVTFSGGEPLMQHKFLLELLQACREEGIHTAVDTSGYSQPDIFSAVAAATDMLLFDLKTTNRLLHMESTGRSNELVISNLKSLNLGSLKLIVRIPLIPGINDQRTELEPMIKLLQSIRQPVERIDLLPFHRLGQHKYEALRLLPSPKLSKQTSTDTREALELFTKAGFRVKQGG